MEASLIDRFNGTKTMSGKYTIVICGADTVIALKRLREYNHVVWVGTGKEALEFLNLLGDKERINSYLDEKSVDYLEKLGALYEL